MALSEFATMDPGELEHRLAESRKELFNLRFQLATGQLDNTARIGRVKKDVARMLTHLRQRDLEIGEEPALERGWAAAVSAPPATAGPAAEDELDEESPAAEDELDEESEEES